MVSVADLIANEQSSSPRPEKRASVDRSGSSRGMQRQPSAGGHSRYDKGAFTESHRGGAKSSGNTMGRSQSQSGKRGGRGNDAGWVESDRRNRGSQRGGPPPVAEPAFEPLSTSENAWKPKRAGGGNGALQDGAGEASARFAEVSRMLTSTLNKLAPEKFVTLSDKVLNLGITNEVIVTLVIDKIFDKALTEQHYASMYARLCRKLSDELPKIQSWVGMEQRNNIFRRLLLNKCQKEFEAGKNWAVEEAEAREIAKLGAENMTAEERAEFLDKGEIRIKSKIRSLGNVRFVGELFLLGMLTEKIMHRCVKNMLQNVSDPEEEEVESMCKFLTTIGAALDHAAAREYMNTYFTRIRELSKNLKLSSRLRFMLLDLIDLRAQGWKVKNAAAGPKTLSEIRKDIDKKDEPQQRSSSSRGGSSRREMPTMRDQFRGDRGSDRGVKGRSSQDSRIVTNGADGWSTVSRSTPPTPSDEHSGWVSPKLNHQSSNSSRSNSRPASPSVGNAPSLPKENKKTNMFELLGKNEEEAASPIGDVQKSSPELTQKQKEERVPSAIREWFSIYDVNEINISLTEIGSDMISSFVSQLMVASCEQKKESIGKTLMLVKDLREEHISVENLKKGISLFLDSCIDEDLFSEFPLAAYVIGSLFGDLVADETMSLFAVDEMVGLADGIRDGRIPDAAKIFAAVLNRLKDQIGEEDTIAFLGDFDLKSLWGERAPEDESYSTWIEKNDIYFLLSTSMQDETGDEPDVSDILDNGLGQIPIEDLISEIQDSISESTIESPDFIIAVTHSLVSYMTSRTIYADGASKPIEPTREMFMENDTMMDDFGSALLSRFINGDESRKLLVLSSIKDFCVNAGYPKKLLEDLFRLLYKKELVEDSVFMQWRDTSMSDSKLKRELRGWFEWLGQEDQ